MRFTKPSSKMHERIKARIKKAATGSAILGKGCRYVRSATERSGKDHMLIQQIQFKGESKTYRVPTKDFDHLRIARDEAQLTHQEVVDAILLLDVGPSAPETQK